MRFLRRIAPPPSRPAPHLSFDERNEQSRKCPDCGQDYVFVTGYLKRDGWAYAVYHAATSGHPEAPEVAMDVILGTWGSDATDDHVTFSCRYRPFGAMAVDAPAARSQGALIDGLLLSRKKALRHPRIDDFWEVADFIALHDPAVGNELRGRSGGGAAEG